MGRTPSTSRGVWAAAAAFVTVGGSASKATSGAGSGASSSSSAGPAGGSAASGSSASTYGGASRDPYASDFGGLGYGGFGGSYGSYGGGYGGYGGYADSKNKDIFDRFGDYGGYGYSGAYGGIGDRASGAPVVPEDDCARVEANGTALADALREAADVLGDRPLVKAPESVRQLVEAFAGEQHQRFLLANCPQSVVLAMLLTAQVENGTGGASNQEAAIARKAAVESIGKAVALAVTLRPINRPLPRWTGDPWENVLSNAQRRTGVVLFPSGEQHFHVEIISTAEWGVHPRRRCRGRRDLGNLQATPIDVCLAKCSAHPLCRSATFWHWQPGGFGFEQRCFLSSSCTQEISTSDGAEMAVLFEKRGTQTQAQRTLMQQTILTPVSGAPWAPRCGHRLLAASLRGGKGTRLWVLGGVGVDTLANTSGKPQSTPDTGAGVAAVAANSVTASVAEPSSGDAPAKSKRPRGAAAFAAARAKAASRNVSSTGAGGSSVIEAYLSRHVELSGELPPLRSLPYGRLGDIWHSDDLGATWGLTMSKSPWGSRSFFGAVAVQGGKALLVLGGTLTFDELDDDETTAGITEGIRRVYTNDVWLADLGGNSGKAVAQDCDTSPATIASCVGGTIRDDSSSSAEATVGLEWRRLEHSPWSARAAFQTVLVRPHQGDEGTATDHGDEELLILGGRLEDGNLANDIWIGNVKCLLFGCASASRAQPSPTWRRVTASAAWEPRADFAAVARNDDSGFVLWVLGGSGQGGRALADVWRSDNGGSEWKRLLTAAPWGPRIGAAASLLDGGVLLVYGGYAYPDDGFGVVENVSAEASPTPSASWLSLDGREWRPLMNTSQVVWSPSTMHAALTPGPCGEGLDDAEVTCAYATGGLTHEGYYDNTAHRIVVPASLVSELKSVDNGSTEGSSLAAADTGGANGSATIVASLVELAASSITVDGLLFIFKTCLVVSVCVLAWWIHSSRNNMDLATRRAVGILAGFCLLFGSLAAYAVSAVAELSRELRDIRSLDSPMWQFDKPTVSALRDALGLQEVETLLRLAARESSLGYGDSFYSKGGGGRGYADSGSRGVSGYDSFYGSYASERGYGYDDAFGSADRPDPAGGGRDNIPKQLAMLPTTQSLNCRSPRCERNATLCAANAPRSLTTPYGCCSDYMLLMLGDVADWLDQQKIPYFITYGTLLGALREGDILPWTQDMDIVVDRAHWPRLQRGLEAADFFGGRRYFFGVDQWEERVSRVCADWDGFAASIIGGQDDDRFTRATEFHLDIYASDWWQVKDLHLIDCVEPRGRDSLLEIRGRNFSAPARPRACVEKLYGLEWRTPKHALSGVN